MFAGSAVAAEGADGLSLTTAPAVIGVGDAQGFTLMVEDYNDSNVSDASCVTPGLHMEAYMRTRNVSLTTAVLVSALALSGVGTAHADELPATSDGIAEVVAAATPPDVAGDEASAVAKPGGSYASEGTDVQVAIPRTTDGEVNATAQTESGPVSVSVGVVADESVRGALASDGSVVYAGQGSTDATVQPTEDGMRIHTVISDASAPTRFVHDVTLSPGLRLVMMSDIPVDNAEGALMHEAGEPSGVLFLDAEDHVVGGFSSPWAKDANGMDVPTHYEIQDGALVQYVDHMGSDVAYPVVADPYLGFSLISSASWTKYAEGRTLKVTPTGWSRANAGSYLAGVSGWDELYSKYKNSGLNTNLDGMRDQYICHQQIVALRSPGKSTWNLDEWRPDVSYVQTVNSSCNPGGAKWFD
ncbi:DUF2599 domain-containing protein [Xylanimonas allomyrinae]|nr:DUF2599 domain-containing protein [Xylanimonas allomyrinae]